MAGRQLRILEIERQDLLHRQRRLRVVSCPRFTEHVQAFGEQRTLARELHEGEQALAEQSGGYARKLRRLYHVLSDTGFLAGDKPTEKGMLAARVYGENALLVVEAIWQGWLDELTPEELCAVLTLLTTEDRGRDRGPRGPRRMPTAAVARMVRRLRSLWAHFAALEEDMGEANLRPLAFDSVDFAYRWASGEPMDSIPLGPNVDIGDAIKSMKNLYSMLRQLEFALRAAQLPLHTTVTKAVRAMERDVIRRT
jgi:superfamily II RNA helicase